MVQENNMKKYLLQEEVCRFTFVEDLLRKIIMLFV